MKNALLIATLLAASMAIMGNKCEGNVNTTPPATTEPPADTAPPPDQNTAPPAEHMPNN